MKRPPNSIFLQFLPLIILSLFAISCNSDKDTITRTSHTHNSFLGVSDLAVGNNRFTFVIRSLEGETLKSNDIQVEFFYDELEDFVSKFKMSAIFQELQDIVPHVHEDGQLHEHSESKGFYAIPKAGFAYPGTWIARFSIQSGNESQHTIPDLAFKVNDLSKVPQVGALIPHTRNPTLREVTDIDEICSNFPADDMHEVSITEALKAAQPFVIIWSAPSFCTSQICSPITRSAIKLQQLFGAEVTFIHIEPWDLNVARNEGRLIPTQEFIEWNLPSEPWVFVVGSNGRVVAKFEGLISENELETSIQRVIKLY